MEAAVLIILLFFVSLLGGVVPLLFRESHRLLHVSLSLAAGFFLGVVFLHLLPELGQHQPSDVAIWPWVLAGLLILLILDLGLFGHRNHHVMGWATLLGLTFHAAAAGLGFGVHSRGSYALAVCWAIMSHKLGEAFSLLSAMRFSLQSKRALVMILVAFSTITPLSMLLGHSIQTGVPASIGTVLSALSVGTFLYVAVGELLPEVFHENRDRLLKLSMLLLGVFFAAMSGVHEADQAALGLGAEASSPLEPGSGFMHRWFEAFVSFFVDSAPYLLLGFLLAGLIRALLPRQWLSRLLGKNDVQSVVTASAIGAPLPLCSCSVLPTALSLRRRGASKGATVAFLVSTPETGLDSIGITYALMDPTMTIARPLAALTSATAAGLATNLAVRAEESEDAGPDLPGQEHEEALELEDARLAARLKDSLRYAFVDLLDDILPTLLFGFAVSALLAALLPEGFFAAPWASGFLGLLLALAIGAPMYICASASTPIAAALIAKGLSPGAALVFLLVGPATNLGSLFVLVRALGRKVVAIYMIAVMAVALLFGMLLNALYASSEIQPSAVPGARLTDVGPWLHQGAACLLLALVIVSFQRQRLLQRVLSRLAPDPPA